MMGNPFCPKCGLPMKVKKCSGTRYWVCPKGHKFKAGATELTHFRKKKKKGGV